MDDGSHGRIRRLPESVVNKIAAGEVVARPSAALKELLENSLDAGATSITVTVRDGGLKLLQVTDDGKGIAQEDLELLCERFATSKLTNFEELTKVATFGFRGEALASISHVSRLSVLTKTGVSPVAYKSSYLDGVMRGAPAATAGVNGTTITIEDMFYNLPTRKLSIKSASDEYRAIVNVVSRYSIRYSEVAFICRRYQSGSSARAASDVRTDTNATVEDNIRAAFGGSIANETSRFQVELPKIGATVCAYTSSANFSMKKPVFILFINGRLVECQPFKRAVLEAYNCFLPKSGYPFAYFDVRLDQADVDVNVHPTKKEVRFLHEEAIVDTVVQRLTEKLKSTETSRTFLAQSVIGTKGLTLFTQQEPLLKAAELNASASGSSKGMPPSDGQMPNGHASDGEEEDAAVMRVQRRGTTANAADGDDSSAEVIPPVKLRRTESGVTDAMGTDESYVGSRPMTKKKTIYAKDKMRTGSDAPVGLYDVFLGRSKDTSDAMAIQAHRKRSANAIPLLTSIQTIIDDCQRNAHKGLCEVLKDHIFIGLASEHFVLLQYSTKLMLAEVDPILSELMYQQLLIRFADHDAFHLKPAAPVLRLLETYVGTMNKGLAPIRISAEACATILLEKAPMLSEYFSISFKGETVAALIIDRLPLVFPTTMPDMAHFGEFLYRLAADVDWSEEGPCLDGISRQLANWYGRHWTPLPSLDASQDEPETDSALRRTDRMNEDGSTPPDRIDSEKEEGNRREWIMRHIFFASLRKDFYPPTSFYSKKVIREITSTAKLYKVFERC